MEISVIASGSNGNCCLVEEKDVSLLIDAGKSGSEIEMRMDSLGKSMENVNAVLLTHAHHDHLSGAGVLSRRYDVPIYMTKDVFSEAKLKIGNAEVKNFCVDKPFRIDGVEVKPVVTSHNVSSCGFIVGKFGLFTDTGMVTKQMEDAISKLKVVLLESNHDIDMVINGPYPAFLKQWILSDEGHLSNIHASSLINERGGELSLALLGHLSGNNNSPDVAKKTFESLVKRKVEYAVCSREKESGCWEV
ncbi:MAG: MBL fold metallo-hydrolase [Candidatus Woesearchaeota archaeon]|jgi:phosphoribosyl 1,2-cyclic phosphodiesterase|nr:MBL fold metallo-hydrolase [Candidatus Woesearchaeota archaeon]MDP7506623.1 MBL fold metallo-hydrolase [Candidatus Woesearchaeota archaeon]MDP7610194.1 MBL fold metallo-hydrolase [Candidatus Woesearchaeota archaeon]|tara:strand:- start:674 stop:1414 length:741 start_codon:yes stop_codon:yes gene_type:complete